ncbi:MAG: hypothetical protein K0M63_11985 [Weeksellaceae bacterium]|nr:hypothetical protein [Weeksellaceae bacterium]
MLKTIKGISTVSAVVLMTHCTKTEKQNMETAQQDTVQVKEVNARAETPKDSLKKVYLRFSGAWFQIEYPGNFTVQPSLRSTTSKEGFDSATFTSPDGKVQFYIFSPQWSGEATDIALKASEKQTDDTSATENGLLVKRWTIQAKDGSYFRSYESSKETGGVNKVFGIRYASADDLKRYRPEYLHFKNSLEQYAD